MASTFELSYRNFPPYKLKRPINWQANPYQSKNWVHNFLSLRWLSSVTNLNDLRDILCDFLSAAQEKSEVYDYVMNNKLDHTISIRVVVLSSLRNDRCFQDLSSAIDLQILNEINLLCHSSLYRFGFNHGLLVDESILKVYSILGEEYINSDLINLVLIRIQKQLNLLFDLEGYTREHSISYQEYNLLTLFNIRNFINDFNAHNPIGVEIIERIDWIIEQSKKLLRAAYRENGEYIPFGDSFRLPNELILRKVYGRTSEQLFNNTAPENLIQVFPFSGFGFIRATDSSGNDWLIGITSSRNSLCHKSNDELSIFVEVNGQEFISDPGYTDRDDVLVRSLKRRDWHSTIYSSNSIDEKVELCPNEDWVSGSVTGSKLQLEGIARYKRGLVLKRTLVFDPKVGLIIKDTANSRETISQCFFTPFSPAFSNDCVSLGRMKIYNAEGVSFSEDKSIKGIPTDRLETIRLYGFKSEFINRANTIISYNS